MERGELKKSAAGNGVDLGRLWWVGLVAILASVVANLIALGLALALVDLPAGFQPLQAGPIILFTTLGVLGAVVVFGLVARFAGRPIRTYWIVAIVALLLSLIPNFALAMDPASAPMPGGTTTAYLVLIVFHVVAALVAVPILTTMTRVR
jgi:hypothetical protein